MSGLSDTLTVGLVLLLLFGSACLYLYTRIQQVETKLNLVESILLDLKMTNELKAYPPLPAPASGAPEAVEQQTLYPPSPVHRSREASVVQQGPVAGLQEVRPFSDDDDEIESLHEKPAVEELASGSPAPVVATAVASSSESVKMSPSYDSMTAKELQALAKQRNIPGTSGLRRAQLIDLLKQSDERSSNHVGIFESLAASSLAESSEEIHTLDA
jgi:hypothetical protein